MSLISSWFKTQFGYLKESLPEILDGLILVFLVSSGVIVAILLRSLDFNGIIITMVSIITEVIALVICYFYFRKYLESEEKPELKKQARKFK